MRKTPPAKWHIALLAALFWLAAPIFNAAHYVWRQANHAYPSNADSIAIPMYAETLAWATATPVYALLAWLVLRTYRGGRSFLAFDTTRLVRSTLFSLLWGGLAAICVYGTIERVFAQGWIDAVSFLPWVYLFLCVRSSAAGDQSL